MLTSGILGVTALALASPAHATPITTTFTYASSTVQTYTVPAGVYGIEIVATGGGGASAYDGFSPSAAGGAGAVVTTYQAVSPGDVLTIKVGGGGGVGGSASAGSSMGGAGITRTDARVAQTGEAGRWSDTYYTVAHGFAVREGSTLDGIEDLGGQTVLTTEGTTADTDLQARLRQAGISTTTLEYVDGEESAVTRVLDGSAYAFAAGVGTIETLV